MLSQALSPPGNLPLAGGLSPHPAAHVVLPLVELSIDFTYNGENDTRIYNPSTGSTPWMMMAGGNTKLMTALSNYAPLK